MITFITGGTSSIGRILVKEMSARGLPMRLLVRNNSRLDGLDLPGVTFVEGDVTNPESVRKGMQGCASVTHMAAIVGQYLAEEDWWRVNRDGSRNVLQAASDLGVVSMVQVSSLSVLGFTQPGETADEARPIDPGKYLSLYQKTKHAADELAGDFAARGLPVKIVFPGFGFGCSRASSHPSMQEMTLLRMAAGKPVAILGSGSNKLFVAYYNDTAAGILLAHERGKPGEGYILGNENLTFPEMWAEIARLLGRRPPAARIPLGLLKAVANVSRGLSGKSVFPPDFFEMISYNWRFSNRKAREELGWQPLSFAAALACTWQAYRDQGWIEGQALRRAEN